MGSFCSVLLSFARTRTHTLLPPTGRISVECVHIWIDMLQLTGPVQDRGRNYWFFANMAACWSWGHIHFHHSDAGRESREVSHLFCQSPWQQGSSKSEEVKSLVRGECGFTKINITWNALHPSLSVCLSRCLSITSAHTVLSLLPQAPSLLLPLLQFFIVVRFSVPHQLGKPFILPLNRGTELPTALMELPSSHR